MSTHSILFHGEIKIFSSNTNSCLELWLYVVLFADDQFKVML